jgi:uncharacterized membrane protein
MTRQAFMARLREGLRGLPPQAVADILADYETHFTEGEAAGRSEADVAAALGDPDRLARELRAESSLARWRDERSPSAAGAAIFAVLGLGAFDLIILLPILMSIGGVIFAFYMASIVGFFAGGAALVVGPFTDFPGGGAASALFGIGVMAASSSAFAINTLISIGLINALVWYGRLHYRLLKPALEA